MADDDIDRDNEEEEQRLGSRVRRIDGQTRALTGSTNAFARAITAAFAQGATGAKSFELRAQVAGAAALESVGQHGAEASDRRARLGVRSARAQRRECRGGAAA